MSADDGDSSGANSVSRTGLHIPALDGFRGLAILLVMIHHQTVIRPSGGFDAWFAEVAHLGWTGVDLFFVLSGFLITGILYDSKQRSHYIRNFYVRRTLRIFPLYYAVVILSLIIIPNLPAGFVAAGKVANFGRIEGREIWYWLYLSNFSIADMGGFRHGILDISWSLAIEEQFYLVWPWVVLACRRRTLQKICIGLVAGSLIVRVGMVLAEMNPVAVFVVTPARMDGLAMGAFIALTARGAGVSSLLPAARVAVPAVLAILFAGALWLGGLSVVDPVVLTVGLTLFAILFGALLVMVLEARPESALSRFFCHRAMSTLGKYSYAIYLFHVPIRAVVRDTFFGPDQFPVVLGSQLGGQLVFYGITTFLTLVIAILSWNLFEKRLLALKRHFPSGSQR